MVSDFIFHLRDNYAYLRDVKTTNCYSCKRLYIGCLSALPAELLISKRPPCCPEAKTADDLHHGHIFRSFAAVTHEISSLINKRREIPYLQATMYYSVRPENRFRIFSENIRRLPKISEDFRGRTDYYVLLFEPLKQ